MSVPVSGFIPHLRVYFFNDGDQSSSICVQMGRWLSAEHGALLSLREVTLRGVRAGQGDLEGMESEVQAQVYEKGPSLGNFHHTQWAYPKYPRWVPAYPCIRGAGIRLFFFNTHSF